MVSHEALRTIQKSSGSKHPGLVPKHQAPTAPESASEGVNQSRAFQLHVPIPGVCVCVGVLFPSQKSWRNCKFGSIISERRWSEATRWGGDQLLERRRTWSWVCCYLLGLGRGRGRGRGDGRSCGLRRQMVFHSLPVSLTPGAVVTDGATGAVSAASFGWNRLVRC